MQTASSILLIRPASFSFNQETSASNAFQSPVSPMYEGKLKEKAAAEFEGLANTLRLAGIDVHVFNDTPSPQKPDAVFPNNWVSFHPDGRVILYPMLAPNRRLERRTDIIEALKKHFSIGNVISLSHHEQEDRFLEGTGSIVFDHVNRTAFACLSPRTDKRLFEQVCALLHYKPVSFCATDRSGMEIYHTNVMMCIGPGFAVVCLESIRDGNEKAGVAAAIQENGLELVDISFSQMEHFAGNMLALNAGTGGQVIVLSQNAFNSLDDPQKERLENYGRLLPVAIDTIESIGGGSARCMIAEIFCPRK